MLYAPPPDAEMSSALPSGEIARCPGYVAESASGSQLSGTSAPDDVSTLKAETLPRGKFRCCPVPCATYSTGRFGCMTSARGASHDVSRSRTQLPASTRYFSMRCVAGESDAQNP